MLGCIDIKKLTNNLINNLKGNNELWIVISSGGFAPIHNSHIGLCKSALKQLTNSTNGTIGIMAYFIPNHASYTAHKLRERKKEVPMYVSKEHIIGSIRSALHDECNLDLCTLDLERKSWCEWFVCASELVNMIKYIWKYIEMSKDVELISGDIPKLKFAYVGGEDLVRSKCGLYKGVKFVDFVDRIFVVPREIESDKLVKFPLASDIVTLNYSDLTLSSTKVRQLLDERKFEELEKVIHPNTLAYLIGVE